MANFAFVVYGDIQRVTGGNYYDRMLIRALEARGYTVTVVSPQDLKTQQTSGNKPLELDVCIVDELCHPDFCSGKDFAGFAEDTLLVAMVHHLAAQERLSPAARTRHLLQERRFLRPVDYCICNSVATDTAVRGIGGYKGPGGIAVPGVSRAGAGTAGRGAAESKLHTGGPVQLLALGNVIPRKGIHHVIASMAIEPPLPCTLVVAGNTEVYPRYTEKLCKQVAKLGLQEKVTFRGFVGEEEKQRLLAAADFLTVPSDHEGYGIVYLEAMEYGTVPVASRSGGAGEVIRDGRNGFLVPPRSPQSIYRIVADCLRKPDLYNELSGNARKTWEQHPSWEATFEEVIDDLEKMTRKKTL
ncbi:MAG: glycosyltransferase family 4 protein [Spirochaetales bacterium]|nr:glycosyltransferase family 4 protein [Spirochaetales bacterium]